MDITIAGLFFVPLQLPPTDQTGRSKHQEHLDTTRGQATGERCRNDTGQIQKAAVSSEKRGRKEPLSVKDMRSRGFRISRGILSFLHSFAIPFTNNTAECNFRNAKRRQKISGTFRSEEGDFAAFRRIRAFIATLKKNDNPVPAPVAGALQRQPLMPACMLCAG